MRVGSLAYSSDPDLILEVLNFMLSSEVSRFQILFEHIIHKHNDIQKFAYYYY